MKIFITFGYSHCHNIFGIIYDKDCVAEIECSSYENGREIAFDVFGPKFCFSYENIDDVKMQYYPRGIIKV